MSKKCIPLLLLLLLFVGCNVLQPPPDLAWDHDPETVIIRVTSGGGLEPLAASYNRIPDAMLWGDGRIVWTTFNDGVREVWQGQLSEAEMKALLETFADKGFWRLDDFYRPKDEVYDSTTTSLGVNLLAENKRVNEYHSGAPRVFYELIGLVKSADEAAKEVYMPQSGFLTIVPINPYDNIASRTWDSETANLSLEDIDEGWIEGPALLQAWEIVNQKYWSPIVVEDGQYYELYLEIPELTGRDPS